MVREIPLTRGMVALVDNEDFERVGHIKWTALESRKTWYAMNYYRDATGKVKARYLHRVLLNAPADMLVDHIDGNGLDCRRGNMRLANRTQNTANSRKRTHNTSGFKGVSWSKAASKWVAAVSEGKKRRYLGSFTCPIEAAKAYDAAARDLFGAFARVNFPQEGEVAA